MSRLRAAARRGGATLAVIALAGITTLTGGAAQASVHLAAHRATHRTAVPAANAVTMTVRLVSPSTPRMSIAPRRLTVELEVHNATASTLTDVAISAVRSDPISSQQRLDDEFAKASTPDSQYLAAVRSPPAVVSLPPHATDEVLYRTTTSALNSGSGICLCTSSSNPALIYPLYFTAVANGVTVGHVQTYLPVFGSPMPKKLTVSWIWPLLDRPHRQTNSRIFTDDDLATEIAPGGRLDDALRTLELLNGRVPLTLEIDPDLLDELEVMSTGYQLRASDGKTLVTGTHGSDAEAWLARLRSVLADNPGIEIDFTPPADPDIDSLSRHGLAWMTTLPAAEQARVATALGGHSVATNVYWPANGTLGRDALRTVRADGVRTVVLSDSTLRGGRDETPAIDALAPVRGAGGPLTAAVTSATLQRLVARTLRPGTVGLGTLPELVSDLAIRAVETPDTSHYVVLAPPRDLDTNPVVAAQTILDTSRTSWSTPLTISEAAGTVTPVDHGALHTVTNGNHLSDSALSAISYVARVLPDLRTLFTRKGGGANAALGTISAALQRTASNSLLDSPGLSDQTAHVLRAQIAEVRSEVSLVRPASGTYTLSSSTSSIPVTVKNPLDFPIRVHVSIASVNGLPGFTAHGRTVQLSAGSTRQVRVHAHVDRVGRIEVQARLSTPRGNLTLGSGIALSVRSTALGTIGVIITLVAAIVLAIALVLRFAGRLRKHRRKRAKAAARPGDAPVAVG